MMSKKVKSLWRRFVSVIEELPEDVSKEDYLLTIAGWINEHSVELGPTVMARWALDSFAALKPMDYPLVESDVNVAGEVATLRRPREISRDRLGAILHNQFWGLITLKTERPCPSCGEDDLRALSAVSEPCEIVFACDFCGFAADRKGRPIGAGATPRPATVAELRDGGVLG